MCVKETKDKRNIEEMALAICKSRGVADVDDCRKCWQHEKGCLYQDIAYGLYREDYRKQSEGKNVAIYPSSAFECSECHWEDWDLYTADSGYNYCPNCGAKMKGGEE